MENRQQILSHLKVLYPDQYESVMKDIEALVDRWKEEYFPSYRWVDNSDVLMIAYGDSINRPGQSPLAALKSFSDEALGDTINLIHLLPMFPFSSDDGFSVIDFREINPDFGDWNDIDRLRKGYDLMMDAVVNHVSKESDYFKGYLAGDEKYKDFFIEADPGADYSQVVRPRALPLLTPFETGKNTKYIWTTFSGDQVDLNYKNPAVLLEILDVLLLYASRGSRFIRFDAIGFAWKEDGTSCMHLPQTHELIKLMRVVVECCAPGCCIITETNVPHLDNISYFGNGYDEAAMVYQFPLPPLVLWSFLKQDAGYLSRWADSLEPTTSASTYFNFLASHDGIGVRPVEGILGQDELKEMVEQVLARGGQVGSRTLPDGSEAPYELNINYLDAVAADCPDDEMRSQKFMASQCILLSMMGMPAIYYHSLLGSRGDAEGYVKSGIKRRINREKLDADRVLAEMRTPGSLRNLVTTQYTRLIKLRKEIEAFSPNSPQRVCNFAPEIFALLRGEEENILVLVNVSGNIVQIKTQKPGKDLISGECCEDDVIMAPWQYRWIELD